MFSFLSPERGCWGCCASLKPSATSDALAMRGCRAREVGCRGPRLAFGLSLVVACLALAYAGEVAVAQTPYIHVGTQSLMSDFQPYIELELSRYDALGNEIGMGPYDSGFGIYPYNRLLLDTGANSALIVSDAAADLYNYGYQTDGFYYEQGVAGYSELRVSAPYNMRITGTDGSSVFLPQTTNQNRILSNKDMDLGSLPSMLGGFNGLVGMPAMVGRVTTIDISDWAYLEDIFEMQVGVQFPTVSPTNPTPVVPPSNGHRYSVPVDTRYLFSPEDGLESPDDPTPVWAPIPFLTAKGQYHDLSGNPITCTGDFLFDTGAQFSLLTRDFAFALGLDEDGDGTFTQENYGTLTVGGIGGSVDAEILLIDKLIIPTEQGVDLVWAPINVEEEGGLMVLVLPDYATQLPFNVLGNDFLNGGVSYTVDGELNIVLEGAPYIEKIQLDFRDLATTGEGTIHFDLSAAVDAVVYPTPGDANGDGYVDKYDAAIVASHWGSGSAVGATDGDFNGDGKIDAADVSIMAANWNPPVPGDANGDGYVDAEDARVVALHWGGDVTGRWADGDFNGDGVVDAADVSIMAANWNPPSLGEAGTAAGVPEPGAVVLFLTGLAALLMTRRKTW